MTAYYGGRTEVRVRRTIVPVVYTDFLSMYPTVNVLMGLWDLLIAERLEIEDATADVRSLLALWLYQAFHVSVTTAAAILFWSSICSAVSYLIAVPIAARIGLINTMVFTHLPSNILLILIPFAPDLGTAIGLLLARSALSQMDVPTRTSYVMAVVTPPERPAAASITAVPKTFAWAAGSMISGYLLTLSSFGWPLVIGGVIKGVYDILLLIKFQKVRPPEEASVLSAQ